MKKVMRQKLVSLWCAAHALGGVNWSQLYDLLATCKVNDDGSLSDNLQISADVIGQRQKTEREQRARTNLERARCAEQKEKFSNELASALHSPPVAELCPALVMLIEQQEEQELRSLADADYGVTDFIEPHLGKEMLTRMVREIKERNDVMLHELSIGEWNNTALNQYRDFAMVWPDRWQTIEGIPTQKVRDWIEGKSAGAAIDGPTWWLVFARRCGYVERDDNGMPKLDDENRTIPLAFDERFEIDHIIMSSTAHEHKVYLNSGLLDHPDNYMIVYRGPNRHKLFQMSIGKICPLKSYLIGPTNTRHVTNSYQHRFSSLEKNRQALLKAATTVLSKKTREQHLVPYNTTYKANQENNMKRLVSNTASRRDASSLAKKNGQSTLTFATEPPPAKRTKVDEGETSATASAEEEEVVEEEGSESDQEMLPDDDDAHTPPGSPPPLEEWMAAYPTEYRTQPGLPQTTEAFAQQKALDARGYVRKYAIGKTNAAAKCNAFDPKTGSHCDRASTHAVGALKLRRCGRCGGGDGRTSHGKLGRGVRGNCCPCEANGTQCWHGNGHTKKGMPMSGYCGTCKTGKCTPEYHASGRHFRKPPSTSSPSTAAMTK